MVKGHNSDSVLKMGKFFLYATRDIFESQGGEIKLWLSIWELDRFEILGKLYLILAVAAGNDHPH